LFSFDVSFQKGNIEYWYRYGKEVPFTPSQNSLYYYLDFSDITILYSFSIRYGWSFDYNFTYNGRDKFGPHIFTIPVLAHSQLKMILGNNFETKINDVFINQILNGKKLIDEFLMTLEWYNNSQYQLLGKMFVDDLTILLGNIDFDDTYFCLVEEVEKNMDYFLRIISYTFFIDLTITLCLFFLDTFETYVECKNKKNMKQTLFHTNDYDIGDDLENYIQINQIEKG